MASATVKAVAVLAAAGVLGLGGWHWATHWRPSPERYPLQGVDRPLAAPVLEWASVRAAGADFAYLDATAGARGRAPSFEANWQALPDAGLRRGAIHLFDACADGRDQADAFNAVVPHTTDALPAAVDVANGDCSANPGSVAREVERFAAAVEAHTGKPIVLRISRSAELRWHVTAALDRPVWVIGDFFRPGYAARPWRLWRATRFRRIDGVDQPLDWDVVAP